MNENIFLSIYQKNMPKKHRNYLLFDFPGFISGSKTYITGITKHKCHYLITGYYEYPSNINLPNVSFVYEGLLNGMGKWNYLNYPNIPNETVLYTHLKGIDQYNNCDNKFNIVGTYRINESASLQGCLYQGELNGTGDWIQIRPTILTTENIINTECNAVNCNILVGNYEDSSQKAFIYDLKNYKYYNINHTGSSSIKANGVFKVDKSNTYIIVGVLTTINDPNEYGYVVTWDKKKNKFKNWNTYRYENQNTVFTGVSYNDCNIFISGNSLNTLISQNIGIYTSLKNICKFSKAKWKELELTNASNIEANSIYNGIVIGNYSDTVIGNDTIRGFVSYDKCYLK